MILSWIFAEMVFTFWLGYATLRYVVVSVTCREHRVDSKRGEATLQLPATPLRRQEPAKWSQSTGGAAGGVRAVPNSLGECQGLPLRAPVLHYDMFRPGARA